MLFLIPISGLLFRLENSPPTRETFDWFIIAQVMSGRWFFLLFIPIIALHYLFVKGYRNQRHRFHAQLPMSSWHQSNGRLLFWLIYLLLFKATLMSVNIVYAKFTGMPPTLFLEMLQSVFMGLFTLHGLFEICGFIIVISSCHIAYDLANKTILRRQASNKLIFFLLAIFLYLLSQTLTFWVEVYTRPIRQHLTIEPIFTILLMTFIIIALNGFTYQSRRSYLN